MLTSETTPDQLHRWRTMRRVGWLVAGAGVISFAIFEVVAHDLGPAPILIFALLPDLTFVAGAGQAHAPRQLPPRAVPFYNLAHQPLGPLALIALASIVPLSLFWFVAGLTWLAHIAIDRAFGYGQRTAEGWQRG
jgi:Domain of unknown function (DUF4260)